MISFKLSLPLLYKEKIEKIVELLSGENNFCPTSLKWPIRITRDTNYFFFSLLSSKEAYEPEESDEDFLDAEIKLRPEAVRFIPDDNVHGEDKYDKYPKTKLEEDFILTGHDGRYGGDMLRYAALVSSSPSHSPEISSQDTVLSDKVRFFGDMETRDGMSAWYDCTLAKPASREVRDSYDQFCRQPDVGSRDSMQSPIGITARKASYEHLGPKVVPKFGSNMSLPEGRSSAFSRNPRFQPIKEESPRDRDVPRGNGTLGRKQPHHWSTPAVFTKRLEDTNNNSDEKGSDTDSVDSRKRGRRGSRHRPHSLYEGKLRPISEQDSDPKLRCMCDEEESDDCLKYSAPAVQSSNSLPRKFPDTESSYLHLERSESQRLSFSEQLKGWNVPNSGSPYDSHPHKDKNPPIDTDSENSVSPAISLVSLSETESDREIARKLYDCNPNAIINSTAGVTLPRAVTKLKSLDSESSSDERTDQPERPLPPSYKEKKPASVTNLNLSSMERADSMDQLKLCDPFFQERRRVSRSSSNASSGIGSVQVSSSETNSIDSPRDSQARMSYRTSSSRPSSGYASSRDSYSPDHLRPGDHSKRSSVSSNRTSSGRASSGYASSRDSYENPDRLRPEDFSKVHARMRLSGRGTRCDDPYEFDPSSSEMDDYETEGTSYNPKVYDEIMALQQEMGVNLDGSDSSRESLKEVEKLSNSELLKYSPNVSPTKYKVDSYSDAEKDQRCSKLIKEYKTNKRLQDVKGQGSSQIYRSWDL